MDENTNLWNKKADELTVGDVVKVNIVAPIIMIGAVFAGCAIAAGSAKVVDKIRKVRENRKTKLIVVE